MGGEAVAAFLRAHPEFLAERPELYRALTPPRRVHGEALADHMAAMLIAEREYAGAMAERVIDGFQTIDIEGNHRCAGVVALDIGDRTREFPLKTPSIEDAKQEIGLGRGLQLLDQLECAGQRPPQLTYRISITGGL